MAKDVARWFDIYQIKNRSLFFYKSISPAIVCARYVLYTIIYECIEVSF